MFTTGDDVPLREVLQKLYEVEKGAASLDPKESEDTLFAKLGEALPTHDRERIYPSDVRKLFAWYDQLLKAGEFAPKAEAKKEVAEEAEKGKAAKKAPAKEAGAKKAKADAPKVAGPKPSVSAKPKATTMRKSAQRGA